MQHDPQETQTCLPADASFMTFALTDKSPSHWKRFFTATYTTKAGSQAQHMRGIAEARPNGHPKGCPHPAIASIRGLSVMAGEYLSGMMALGSSRRVLMREKM